MLTITIEETEFFNEQTEEFFTLPGFRVDLEHSLVSLSKWESKFEKPFLSNAKKDPSEILEYFYMMVLTPNTDRVQFLNRITQDDHDRIAHYIESKQTATTFGDMPKSPARSETITSELIYYWMIAFNIPFECEHWHLNRLFSLIRVCNIKNAKPKKMSKHEVAARNRELNAQRKAELNTSG